GALAGAAARYGRRRSAIGQALSFATQLYRQQADTVYAGYIKRDPMALLRLRPGRQNPYAIYDRMRAAGPLVPTRLGNWASTSHRLCNAVLRDRRMAVRPLDSRASDDDEFEMSFLSMNPPDHTRLRRLAQPAFSPKAVATYRERIERTVHELLDRAGDEFDLVSALAAPLPIAVITDLLGIRTPTPRPSHSTGGSSAARWTASGHCGTRPRCRPTTRSC